MALFNRPKIWRGSSGVIHNTYCDTVHYFQGLTKTFTTLKSQQDLSLESDYNQTEYTGIWSNLTQNKPMYWKRPKAEKVKNYLLIRVVLHVSIIWQWMFQQVTQTWNFFYIRK